MFVRNNPYVLNKIWTMHDACSKCGQHYQLEPSFYYGAMYVNYGITVAIAVSVFVAMYGLGNEWEFMHYILAIISAIILSAPLTFRLGRMVWINMFVGYKPDLQAKPNSENKKSH
jgi:uncharacterized protein (DUF983 family)